MAKIDVTKIEGYAEMSAEDKLKALENFNLPDPDYSGYISKEQFDKLASELAAKKKELNDKLSEDEKKKAQEEEERKSLEDKYNKLLRESAVAKNKAKLVGLGYDEKLADETAEAMADGKLDKVFENQKKFLEGFEKSIKAEVLKNTPDPTGDGNGGKTMTLENLRKMSQADRMKYATEHPDEYRELYEGESTT